MVSSRRSGGGNRLGTESSQRVPKALRDIFPDVVTLGEAVEILQAFEAEDGEGGEGRAIPQASTETQRDQTEPSEQPACSCSYWSEEVRDLLGGTYVAFSSRAPDLVTWFQRARNRKAGERATEAAPNQKRLVHEVVLEKFKVGKSSSSANPDVACFGFRKSSQGGNSRGIRMMNAMGSRESDARANYFAVLERTSDSSVPADLLTTPVWERLLVDVGRDVMKYVLLYSSIFVTQAQEDSKGKCFHMQASGLPISSILYTRRLSKKHKSELAAHSMFTAAARPAIAVPGGPPAANPSDLDDRDLADFCGIATNPELEQAYCRSIFRKACRGTRARNPPTEDDVDAFFDSNACSDSEGEPSCDILEAGDRARGGKRKPVRLPSWQRKKIAKAAAASEIRVREEGKEEIKVKMADQKEQSPPALTPPPALPKKRVACVTTANMTPGTAQKTSKAREGKREKVPGSLKLPRCFLYNAKACLRSAVGLPRNHVLMTLSDDAIGASHLVEAIFLQDLKDLSSERIGGGANKQKSQKKGQAKKPADTKVSIPKSLRHMEAFAKHMIQKARACPYAKLLERFCPIPSELAKRGLLPAGEEESHSSLLKKDLLEYSSPARLVGDFIWAVLSFIVPKTMLGTKTNQRALRTAIHKFLCKKRYEEMRMEEAVFKTKTGDFGWLRPPEDALDMAATKTKSQSSLPKSSLDQHARDSYLLRRWIYWVFHRVVDPLRHVNFYSTDAEARGYKIYYFRQSFWRTTCWNYLRGLAALDGGGPVLEEVDEATLAEIVRENTLGMTFLRLVPKGATMRVISNQSKNTKDLDLPKRLTDALGSFDRPSTNSCLKAAGCIIRAEMKSIPGLLGASCFSYYDIYQKLCTFLHEYKTRSASQKLYVVSCDVHKAYDTVDAQHLLKMVNGLLRREDYDLRKYARVIDYSHGFMAKQMQTCEDFPPQGAFEEGFCHLNEILVNKASSSKVQATAVRATLSEHLLSNLVYAYGKLYRQRVGIPQGSILSTLLCSFYLANLEVNKIFPMLNIQHTSEATRFHVNHRKPEEEQAHCSDTRASVSPNVDPSFCGRPPLASLPTPGSGSSSGSQNQSVILRFVDDYLYISTVEADAQNFLRIMHQGFPEYNCCMNRTKTSCNFSPTGEEGDAGDPWAADGRNLWHDGKGTAFLKWCGLLINIETFEVQADFSRLEGSALRQSVFVPQNLCRTLKDKVIWYLRIRTNNSLLWDTVVNGPTTVRLNIYQCFLVMGMKLVVLLQQMRTEAALPGIVYEAMESAQAYMIYRVGGAIRSLEQRMRDPSYGSYRNRVVKEVPRPHIRWLGLMAFLKVMRRKQTKYRGQGGVIERIERDLARAQFKRLPAQLAQVVDPERSDFFDRVSF